MFLELPKMALHCAVALALSFWFVRVFMCVRWVLCVCVRPLLALLVAGLALIV